jgi:hypothetical protein
MAIAEITTEQARYIARMRLAWPDAEVRVHQEAWGVIVEVLRDGRTIALSGFDGHGAVRSDWARKPAAA